MRWIVRALRPLLLVSALVVAACGGAEASAPPLGSTGGGGGSDGGASGSSATGAGSGGKAAAGAASGGGSSSGGTSSGGGASSSGGTSSSGGGAGAGGGGAAGAPAVVCTPVQPCPLSQYCDYPDGQCGKGEDGECRDLPTTCDPLDQPVCGCNAKPYSSICLAAKAGTDVKASCGGADEFPCGPTTCMIGEYCLATLTAGKPTTYACWPLPGPCNDCICLQSASCKTFDCTGSPGSGFQVSCWP